MKNKYKLKKILKKIFLSSLVIVVIFLIINAYEYRTYQRNFNHKLLSIITILEEKYPNLTQNEIIEIINSKKEDSSIFSDFNIDIEKDSVILENDQEFIKFFILSLIFLVTSLLVIILIFLKFNNEKDQEIKQITKCIEEINKKNYKLDLDNISEDELSILKNEIYKTTIMLKEQALNSNKEKIELKDALSDISHQLKTPLTSILIILDNLIEDADMPKEVQEEFLFDIKREINNINFLVQSLLKLSKLDTNTVTYINKNLSLKNVVDESVKRLSLLCDVKDIKININCPNDALIYADFNWQVEAITNILKNSIEHSFKHKHIDITIKSTKVYQEISIKDYGKGIEKEDLPHIFERFYKGKNSSPNSIGIGLALSKTIIEKANGKVSVTSIINKETTFTIKYFK